MILGPLFILYGQGLYAQDLSYYLSSDTISYMSGGRIILTQEWSHPKNIEVDAPPVPDRISKLEKVREGEINEKKVDGRIVLNRNVVYTCFDTGYYQIDPLGWRVLGDSIFSNPLFLNVYYAEVDTTEEIRDIEQPLRVSYGVMELLPYAVGFFAILALISGFYVFYSLNKKASIKKEEAHKPPYIVAFERLEKLRSEKLWQKGEVKEYHLALSLIIRTYIQRHYNRSTADLTTFQLKELCKELVIPQVLTDNLEKHLKIGDLAKFAKANPLPEENEMAWEAVHHFVSETMRQPDSEKEEEKNG